MLQRQRQINNYLGVPGPLAGTTPHQQRRIQQQGQDQINQVFPPAVTPLRSKVKSWRPFDENRPPLKPVQIAPPNGKGAAPAPPEEVAPLGALGKNKTTAVTFDDGKSDESSVEAESLPELPFGGLGKHKTTAPSLGKAVTMAPTPRSPALSALSSNKSGLGGLGKHMTKAPSNLGKPEKNLSPPATPDLNIDDEENDDPKNDKSKKVGRIVPPSMADASRNMLNELKQRKDKPKRGKAKVKKPLAPLVIDRNKANKDLARNKPPYQFKRVAERKIKKKRDRLSANDDEKPDPKKGGNARDSRNSSPRDGSMSPLSNADGGFVQVHSPEPSNRKKDEGRKSFPSPRSRMSGRRSGRNSRAATPRGGWGSRDPSPYGRRRGKSRSPSPRGKGSARNRSRTPPRGKGSARPRSRTPPRGKGAGRKRSRSPRSVRSFRSDGLGGLNRGNAGNLRKDRRGRDSRNSSPARSVRSNASRRSGRKPPSMARASAAVMDAMPKKGESMEEKRRREAEKEKPAKPWVKIDGKWVDPDEVKGKDDRGDRGRRSRNASPARSNYSRRGGRNSRAPTPRDRDRRDGRNSRAPTPRDRGRNSRAPTPRDRGRNSRAPTPRDRRGGYNRDESPGSDSSVPGPPKPPMPKTLGGTGRGKWKPTDGDGPRPPDLNDFDDNSSDPGEEKRDQPRRRADPRDGNNKDSSDAGSGGMSRRARRRRNRRRLAGESPRPDDPPAPRQDRPGLTRANAGGMGPPGDVNMVNHGDQGAQDAEKADEKVSRKCGFGRCG